jgi:hypothetical protein
MIKFAPLTVSIAFRYSLHVHQVPRHPPPAPRLSLRAIPNVSLQAKRLPGESPISPCFGNPEGRVETVTFDKMNTPFLWREIVAQRSSDMEFISRVLENSLPRITITSLYMTELVSRKVSTWNFDDYPGLLPRSILLTSSFLDRSIIQSHFLRVKAIPSDFDAKESRRGKQIY